MDRIVGDLWLLAIGLGMIKLVQFAIWWYTTEEDGDEV